MYLGRLQYAARCDIVKFHYEVSKGVDQLKIVGQQFLRVAYDVYILNISLVSWQSLLSWS